MGAAEGGQEVIQGVFVGYVGGLQLELPAQMIGVKEIVGTDGDIEHISGRNARRIGVLIEGPWRRDGQSGCAVTAGAGRNRIVQTRINAAAVEPNGLLLIGGKGQRV